MLWRRYTLLITEHHRPDRRIPTKIDAKSRHQRADKWPPVSNPTIETSGRFLAQSRTGDQDNNRCAVIDSTLLYHLKYAD